MRSLALALALVSWCCAKPAGSPRAPLTVVPEQPVRHAPTMPPAPPRTATLEAAPSAATPAALPPSRCSADLPPAAFSTTGFTRIHSEPVLSAAVGTPPRAAVWSGQSVFLFDGAQARELPAPTLPPRSSVELFFGRDNQPRLMGFAPSETGDDVPVYLRFRQGTFRAEPSELGPLARPPGALYGVLGFADPEVVCRPRELCLVKRTTGWQRAPAHDAPAHVILRNDAVFALRADRIERLVERSWTPLEPARAFDHPLDAWLAPSGELWVVDSSADGLFRLRSGRWEPVTSPIAEPRAVFGRSERALFVVGTNGAAEFDGHTFRCVSNVSGPLHLAFAVGDSVWLAGESGVYRSGE